MAPITEQLLQFIWQHQLFSAKQLATVSGEAIQILKQGILNRNQGPDFLHASIQLNQLVFHGNIELHIAASHWIQHKHESDAAYKQLILHVVWRNDVDLAITSNALKTVPTLELQPLVANTLLQKYSAMMQEQNLGWLLCKSPLEHCHELTWQNWLERMAVERLQQKTELVKQAVADTKENWEEVLWQQVAKYMGGTVNAAAFEAMAKQLPQRLIAKYTHNYLQVEALVFGQLGLLETGSLPETADPYLVSLQREYVYLQQLHSLPKPIISVQWLRMRPAGFPTIRAAQLAAILVSSKNLFQACIQYESLPQLTKHLQVKAGTYWQNHYRFGEAGTTHNCTISDAQIQILIINAIIPVLFAYAKHMHHDALQAKLMDWLNLLPAEKNSLIAQWKSFGVKPANALQTQGLLQLQKQYCTQKKCLQCAVGVALLRK